MRAGLVDRVAFSLSQNDFCELVIVTSVTMTGTSRVKK